MTKGTDVGALCWSVFMDAWWVDEVVTLVVGWMQGPGGLACMDRVEIVVIMSQLDSFACS
jgi:hypothetical protein